MTLTLVFSLAACAGSQFQLDNKRVLSSFTGFSTELCEISDQEKERILTLDYKSFDQALPDGGWRKFDGCDVLMQDLLDSYIRRHGNALELQQKNTLLWHSGQVAAFLRDYSGAISRMEQTLNSKENSSENFLWNPYVRATIAFLKSDKSTLLRERNNLEKGSSPYNKINLRVVDSFIRCFNSSYKEAYSHNCQPKETNLERIKSLAIRISDAYDIPAGIRDFLQQKKVILVGEMHGTKEVPTLFGKIVEAVSSDGNKTLVILEINQSSQLAIDEFLKTNDEELLRRDAFFSREYQDGRSSRSMVNLLKSLSKVPNVSVLAMDPLTDPDHHMTGQQRDEVMASFVHSKMSGFAHTVVLTGNIHSAVIIGTPWDAKYRPLGYEVRSLLPDKERDGLFSVLIRYEKLGSWQCQGETVTSCKAWRGSKVVSDYSRAVKWNQFFVNEGPLADGHSGTIFIRNTLASPPAF